MPVVTVDMWQGRTPEQKKQLVEGLTQAFASIGTPKEKVIIIFNEHAKSDWAEAGRLASEE
ncbi:MAG: tautomerase family protein [Dehalococcoidia bacterium]|nr:tautomerase family protein [Dehalococcoidia bacterium]